jgi:hypothetical protein
VKASLLYILGLLALTTLLISACAPPVARAELQATATPIVEATLEPPAEPEAPAEAPTAMAEEQPDTFCVACHSNQEDLQRLAEQPPETVSLSEGSG